MYEQDVLKINDSGIQDEEGKKIYISNPITAIQRQSGRFLLFTMEVHPYQADIKCKNSRMTCSTFIQLPLYVDGIDAIIDT